MAQFVLTMINEVNIKILVSAVDLSNYNTNYQ